MKRLIAGVLLLVSCGCGDSKPAVNVVSSYRRAEVQKLVATHQAGWDNWGGVIVFNDGNQNYPANQGNGNLFHGLLCYSGHDASCAAVIQLLRCPTGHLKRAPWMPCGDESRDEYIGQSLTAIRTGSVFGLPGSYPFAVTPTWARTMQLAGFNIKGVPDSAALLLQAKSVPANYELHLVALQAWIRRDKGDHTQANDLTFVELRKRHPGNLFYDYLRSGATNDIIDKFLAQMPPEPVQYQAQWTWQDPASVYGYTRIHSAAIVFLGNLLMR